MEFEAINRLNIITDLLDKFQEIQERVSKVEEMIKTMQYNKSQSVGIPGKSIKDKEATENEIKDDMDIECNKCLFNFTTLQLYNNHKKECSLKCPKCEKCFKTKIILTSIYENFMK